METQNNLPEYLLPHLRRSQPLTPAATPPVLNPGTGHITASQVLYAVNPYKNTACITALVLGLCTFVTFGATGIPAAIFGHLGLRQCRQGTANQQGLAIAGMALGYLAIVGWCIWIGFWVVAMIIGFAGQGQS